MTLAVFYTFAVADDVAPVIGAAVHEVLARQLPHLVVYKMNAGRDRGLRFFPLMGTVRVKPLWRRSYSVARTVAGRECG